MSHTIKITKDADQIPSDMVLNDESHTLSIKVDRENDDVYLEFSTQEAMRDFAKNLIHESYYGSGEIELYPLGQNGSWHVVDGARLTENSSRVFVRYPKSNT